VQDVSLAIDDNFHLWDSGYISIPYDFDVKTVAKEVTRLLAPVTTVPAPNVPATSHGSSPASHEEVCPSLPAPEVHLACCVVVF
jgi:hypothetical protein